MFLAVTQKADDQIGVFQAENSQQTQISEIPEHVVNALLAIEDRNFRL
ncbi:MAG: hypothetical protein EBW73_11140, partial [Betaproteobacteria bacterium]|nr:hypothetical protein [Betaproteobacteria bacterium]